MEQDKISDDVRYVVNGRHIGAIFPTNVMELNREVYLNDGADIEGAIYAHSLYIRGGDITVSRSIFSNNTLKISLEKEGMVNLKASLGVGRSLYIEDLAENNYVRIRGDVHLGNANLKKIIVYGNIYGHHINLDHAAVLGGIFATGKVTVKNSLVGTFLADRVNLNDGTTLWLTEGIGEHGVELSGDVSGFTFSLPKVFLDLIKGKPADIPFETFGLIQDDVRLVPRSFQAHSGQTEASESGPEMGADPVHCLSLSPRLYQSKGAARSFKDNLKTHSLLLNMPGIPEKDREDHLGKFDDAIWKYLKVKK